MIATDFEIPVHLHKTTATKATKASFFALSAELRNEIYRLALPIGEEFQCEFRWLIPVEPALLRVNC